MGKLAADFGYTIDGETLGAVEDETFSADGAVITIQGVSAHPGFAKDRMESAIKIAGDIIAALPRHTLSPETTEGKEGFIHPVEIKGTVEQAVITFIIRDFTEKGLQEHEAVLKEIAEDVLKQYPHSAMNIEITKQYRNFKAVLDANPQVVEYALEAIQQAGVKPHRNSIRGGTDGSRLSFMGLPCPNIFAGEHAFHSKVEWVSVQDMQKAVDTIVNLALVWAEKTA